jgi:ABC-2 type transport system permease protein
MKKLFALIKARNLEFYRDRAALSWTLIFPFIVLAGFTYGYSGKSDPLINIKVTGIENLDRAPFSTLKEIPGIDIQIASSGGDVLKKLSRYETDLVIQVNSDGKTFSYSTNQDSERGKLAERLLKDEMKNLFEPRPQLSYQPVVGKKVRYSDWLLPGLLAMNIMFGSMFGVGYVIVRYRKNGVLKRLRATPLRAFQFLTAQIISRMILMVSTSFLVVGGAMIITGFQAANFSEIAIDLFIFLCISAAAMISVGLVVAAQISSEEVADGILNLLT